MPQCTAIGYCRVSTLEQGDSGAGLSAQRATIEAEAARQGWDLELVEDVASGKTLARRPALATALEDLDAGRAHVLVVAKLDRLSRSLVDFARLMERAKRRGWRLIAVDLGVDTGAPTGRLVANVMASVAEWEREAIGQRTREALAVKKAEGVRLGRPPVVGTATRFRIQALRASGLSWAGVADVLNADGVPTAQGGARWYPATVRKVAMATVAA